MAQPSSKRTNGTAVADLTGTTVGRYAIRSRVGSGGMGEVYRADDTSLKRSVALKRIAPRLQSDPSYRQRFLREAQFASGLNDQHIARVYDVLEANDEMFVVMEFVDGVSLRQRLAEPMGIEPFLKIGVQCAEALVAAHGHGVVHHDIKPENIMLTPTGQVRVLDFGVAKQLFRAEDLVTLETVDVESASSGGGTLPYMAPEVLLGKESDSRADIYSLGVVFYEALAGHHPFRAGSFVSTTSRILHELPAPLRQRNPKASAELERIVTKMLTKDPEGRYATAADLLVDLRAEQRALAYPAPPGATPAGVPPDVSKERAAAPRWKMPRRRLIAAAGALLAVGIAWLPIVRRNIHWLAPVESGSKNLAVLPFQAIGGGPENQVYCDGITETLTVKLSQLTASHNLQVTSAADVRSRRVSNAAQARDELGADLALEGTLLRAGNTIRVNYALVNTGTLKQLRAETITADASDPFALQDKVAAGIVRMLELELKPQERKVLESHGTQVAGAYDFYLQGRGYLQGYDKPENIDNAISVFQRALSLDPNYALAHAGLGEAYWQKYQAGKESSWIDASRRACDRAVAIDATLAPAHVCLGTLHNGTGKYADAVEDFQQALKAEPTSDAAYRGLGSAYEHLGKLQEAERTYREAISLRPNYWASYNWLGAFYYRQARYAEAAEMFGQVVALAPDSFRGLNNLGAMDIVAGRYDAAVTTLQRSLALRPTAAAYSNLGNAYFYQRRFADAARAFEEALKLDERNYTVWWSLGDAYQWMPEKRALATGPYQKAITLASKKLEVNPRDTDALQVRAFCRVMLKEKKPALADLAAALKIAPNDADLNFQAALVYNQLGNAEEALKSLERAFANGYAPSRVRDTPYFENLHSNPKFQALLQARR
ncbi:MAG TPA: tetratricopeptide repeat protein [Candidatus Acidoferrum sp.]|nr:tetratricopeptide repeat protein [Candidatus Acidoferrum sp.]